MGDRGTNFEDPSTWTQDIRNTKFDLLGFFNTLYIATLSFYPSSICCQAQPKPQPAGLSLISS
jgi:hypothetical protein